MTAHIDPTRELPPERAARCEELERSYLQSGDPIRQSGFGGGARRWRAEREPILDAITGDGDLLDVGCANGHLLECLVAWGRERRLQLVPHGVDRGARLVDAARERLPDFAGNLHLADAWIWQPPRRYRFVYALHDSVPRDYLSEYVVRLLERVVEPGGRLALGAYGSHSRRVEPLDVAGFLASEGHQVKGCADAGDPTIARFAWIDG